MWEHPRFSRWPCRGVVHLLRSLPRRPDRCARSAAVRAGPISGGSSAHVSSYIDTACHPRCQTTVVRTSRKGNRADVGAIWRRAGAIEYFPGGKDRQTAPRRLVRLKPKSWLQTDGPPPPCPTPAGLWSAAIIATLVRPPSAAHGAPVTSLSFSTSAKAAMNRRTPKAQRRAPARLGGTRNRVPSLEQAVRRGPKRTGHGGCPNPCGVGTPWVFALALPSIGCACSVAPRRPDRGGTPTAVRAGPISGGSSAHLSSSRHGLQPAVSDYGCPRKQGQPCGRRGNLPEGRSDRILPRQERSSNRPPPACPAGAEVLVARRTAFPCHVRPRSALWSAAIHCRFGTARERSTPSHLSPLSAFSTSAKAAMNRRTPKRRRAPLLGWAGPETVCDCLEQAVRGGPKRTGARTVAQIRAVWERPRFSRWPCRRLAVPASVAPTPAGPGWHTHGCPRGSDIRRLVCPSFVVRRHGLQPAVSDYGGPRVKQGQPCGRRGNSPEGRSDRILPRQESRQTAPRRLVRLSGVLVARWTAFPRHVRPRSALGVRQSIAAFVRPAERRGSAFLPPSLCVFHIGQSGYDRRTPKAPARGPSGWAGPETVWDCLEQAVRRGPKRTGARTFAQIRAVWERP